MVELALYQAFNAEYGPLILEQSDLDTIHESVMRLQQDMAKSQALSQKWDNKSQIEPPKHLGRFPFPAEMEEAICLYLFEEEFGRISQRGKNAYNILQGTTFYDFEAVIFEALDQQCMAYNIEPETLENMKQTIRERHNNFIDAQQNADPRLRDFSTNDLTPS